MKYIATFSPIEPKDCVTIDAYNTEFQNLEIRDFLDTYLPYTKLFEQVTVKNFTTIPALILERLTNQYLHGTVITVSTPRKHFEKSYKTAHAKPFYTYSWKPYDLTMPIPKSLAEFVVEYQGKRTTYREAVSTLKTTKFIPNELWKALDVYSKQRIDKCRAFNRGDYSLAELWYKELLKDCRKSNISVFSPNAKTFYEAMAEIDFERDCKMFQLRDGLRPLNQEELTFLRKYAPAYGVEIPTFKWNYTSRKTAHGYTEEPQVCLAGMSSDIWDKVIYDFRKDDNLPGFVRQGYKIQEVESQKLLRDAYFQLTWLMKHLGDDFLMPGWKRCPECHELYREHEGCECGACPSIEFINAENLFYGNAEAFEDIESTAYYYQGLV